MSAPTASFRVKPVQSTAPVFCIQNDGKLASAEYAPVGVAVFFCGVTAAARLVSVRICAEVFVWRMGGQGSYVRAWLGAKWVG